MSNRRSRRTVVRTAGVVLAGAIAGCGGDDTSDGSEPTDTTTTSPEDTPTETPESGTDGPPSVDEFLANTSNYDGIEDLTGSASVGVDVGVEANGAFYGFGPPAIRVDRGTTVTWTWSGQGGIHNVESRYGEEFTSQQTSEEGYTFEYTFEETGTTLYVCNPHEATGMKGAVVVE